MDTTEDTLIDRFNAICEEIFDRWDKDMRSGKLLAALAGRLPGYNPHVNAIREHLTRTAPLSASDRGLLIEARDLLNQYVKEAGGCDHSVGICACADFALLDRMNKATYATPAQPPVAAERIEQEVRRIVGSDLSHAQCSNLARAIAALSGAIEPGAMWRHKKRGTSYVEVARGELQAEPSADLCEGDEMIAYRGDDGRVWFRRVEEFEDGRFERLATTPAQPPATESNNCSICGERDYPTRQSRCEHPNCPPSPAAERVTAEPVARQLADDIERYGLRYMQRWNKTNEIVSALRAASADQAVKAAVDPDPQP